MKIVFTGSGTGGHFYPLIAVAEEVNTIVAKRKLLPPELYFIGPEPYDRRALYEAGITFRQSPAGKVRRYFSFLNIVDLFKIATGIVGSIFQLYKIYPDVIFSKGGYASFPTLVAARLLRIPVVIHESDAHPGRVNAWAGKFAQYIAVAYPEVAEFFKNKDRVILTGIPVRHDLQTVGSKTGAEFLKLENNVPAILILGGSQGSKHINDTILDALPGILEKYQIIHQTGPKLHEEVARTADFILRESEHKERYHAFPFLNPLQLRMAAGAADIIISRAGSGSIFEIATWGKPSILIPIPEHISHDQRRNAYAYARTGAAVVIEQDNLTDGLLISEINRLEGDPALRKKLSEAASAFATPQAATTIAQMLLDVALSHEN